MALVTGCSSGIGVQMAKALASAGANVVGAARSLERVEASTTGDLLASYG